MNSDDTVLSGSPSKADGDNIPEPPIRTKLVSTAAEFLLSPSVQKSSMDLKVAFLKKKGLSDAEIDLAVKQSDARLMAIRDNGPGSSAGQMQLPSMYYQPPGSRWTTFRDIANSMILIGGFFYGAYWTYQTVILPYFYGKKDKKSLEDKLTEIDETLSTCVVEINSNITKFKDDFDKFSDKCIVADGIHKEINELKSEVSSLKKLLLNRKQFPSVGIGALSIPSWQISENEEKQQQTPEEEGNGSNGSESSLEMIKE